jgi:protease-4
MRRSTLLALIATLLLTAVFFVAVDPPSTGLFGRTKIGRVNIEGVIDRSEEIIDQMETFRRDDSVGAVILRVDSPGGGVGPSQEIYKEVAKLRDEGKLVVVSMGSVAASGGYYVSCPADYIFANPGTITGSIGVIAEFTNIEELLGKVGVKVRPFKSGKLKDVGSPFREMDEEERVFLQELISDTYASFLGDVVRERELTEQEVAVIRDGRILSGNQALKLGLIDDLGNFRDTIDYTAGKLGIDVPQHLTEHKEKKGLIDYLKEPAERILPPALRGQWGLRLSYLYVP